jgi:TctA family transporter
MGLGLGLLPGIGGVAGTALLLPFTYELDPHAAFALLLGLGATTTTADPISAILFGCRVMRHRRQQRWTAIR